MLPITTITLNPALDLATSAPEVRPSTKLRCEAPRVDPGGGGINVARAVRLLGGEAFALVAAGGSTGAQLLALLAREGVRTGLLASPGDTRISLSVADRKSGAQYRFMLPGPAWSDGDVAIATSMLEGALLPGGLCVLSGSQPPGLADSFPATFAAICARRDARLVVDTAGGPLAALVADPGPGVEVLRMNHEEAEALKGRRLVTPADTAAAAAALVERGVARMVIVARGPEGSVMATPHLRVFARAPSVPVGSLVGAGDSFVAGFTLGLARDLSAEESLLRGVAAAAAAVMTEGTALCRLEDVERLLPQCVTERL